MLKLAFDLVAETITEVVAIAIIWFLLLLILCRHGIGLVWLRRLSWSCLLRMIKGAFTSQEISTIGSKFAHSFGLLMASLWILRPLLWILLLLWIRKLLLLQLILLKLWVWLSASKLGLILLLLIPLLRSRILLPTIRRSLRWSRIMSPGWMIEMAVLSEATSWR